MLRGRSLRVKVLAGLASVTVIAAGVIGWQITHKGPPAFRRGGQFAVTGPPSSTTSSSALSAETTATTAAAATQPATPTSAEASSSTATTIRKSGPASSTTATSRSAAATATTRARSGPAPTSAPTRTRPTAPAPAPAPAPKQPSGPSKPAVGTYMWTVDGTEQAPFVGSRRYPERMTMVVHTGGGGLEPDQLVFDITYSDQHAEREIVGFRNDGIYFDFEGGSITFGPRTETSQADYEPPILQIPLPLQAGLSRSGVTEAREGGKVSRIEDWKTTVVGQEAVTVGGTSVNAWKIEVQRKFRPGSADQGYRNRTYWFDPARHLWVKYTEIFHGERKQAGFSFSYDSNLTAVLAGFTP